MRKWERGQWEKAEDHSAPMTSRQPHSPGVDARRDVYVSRAGAGATSSFLCQPSSLLKKMESLGLVFRIVWHHLAIISSFVPQLGLLPVVVKKRG